MNKLKDKLSASVRQAKAAQTPSGKGVSAASSAKSAAAPATKPAPASAAKPVAAKPVAKTTAPSAKPAETQSQISPLYPNRVWPD